MSRCSEESLSLCCRQKIAKRYVSLIGRSRFLCVCTGLDVSLIYSSFSPRGRLCSSEEMTHLFLSIYKILLSSESPYSLNLYNVTLTYKTLARSSTFLSSATNFSSISLNSSHCLPPKQTTVVDKWRPSTRSFEHSRSPAVPMRSTHNGVSGMAIQPFRMVISR